MGRPSVIIRADGGPSIGGGHVARAKIIASALQAGGCQVHIISKENDWTKSVMADVECKVVFLRTSDNESLILSQAIKRLRAGLVIMDVQDTSPEYIRCLKETGVAVMTIDDDGRGAELADAAFRAGVKASKQPPVRDYFGLPYAILSPKIAELRERSISPAPGGKIDTVVCFFGTFDPKGHWKYIRGLADHFPKFSFKWFTLSSQPPHSNLEVRRLSGGDFFEAMLKADLALISGGVTLFETMALGRPAVVLPQAEHENDQAEIFSSEGAAVLVPAPNLDLLVSLLDALNQTPERLRLMHDKGMSLIDGRGLERFVNVAHRLLNMASGL